jgi:hypothetical protein
MFAGFSSLLKYASLKNPPSKSLGISHDFLLKMIISTGY